MPGPGSGAGHDLPASASSAPRLQAQEARPKPARALSGAEREAVLDALNSERFVDCSPAQVWATLLDEGTCLCSERTMYRVLATEGQTRERRNQLTTPASGRGAVAEGTYRCFLEGSRERTMRRLNCSAPLRLPIATRLPTIGAMFHLVPWAIIVVLTGAGSLVTASLAAQDPGDPPASRPASGWERVGFPYVNFGSDEGLGYGVVGGAYLRAAEDERPYRLSLEPTLFFTTEGRRDLTLFVDAPGVLPAGWRADLSAGNERHLAVPYYGMGNETPYAPELEEDGHPSYYRFGRDRSRVSANLQHTLPGTTLRVLVGIGAARTVVEPGAREEGTTLLAEELGSADSLPALHTRSTRIGLIRDTRDHEAAPRRGSWTELLVERYIRSLGGDLAFTRWTLADRRFIPVTRSLTFANRLLLQEVRGDPPPHELMRIQSSFKEQEGLGGSGTVRGLPQNRYVGRSLFLWNAELRWAASEVRVLRFGVRPGVVAFVDSGRVWEEGVRVGELSRDLHHGAGVGLRLRLGESFLASADLGRSSGYPAGFYLGVGHLF